MSDETVIWQAFDGYGDLVQLMRAGHASYELRIVAADARAPELSVLVSPRELVTLSDRIREAVTA